MLRPAPFACLLLLLLVLAPSVQARTIRAEGVLPPGQSGFVSPTGVASGTGSPHLTDQTPLFVDFKRKPFGFNLPGETETPRPDVRIVRDAYGVPAVTGQSDEAAWWGAGYAVAQDRLFQMELFRRATTGRLAEILGESYLDDDLIARRDYYTAAERAKMLEAVPARLRARIAAYRDGVNSWIAHVRQTPSDMPGEFAALGVPLTDWTEDDTVAIGIFLARTVPQSSGAELPNLRALRGMGAPAFDRYLPLRAPGRLSTIPRREGVFPSQPGRTRKQERAAFKRSVRASAAWPLPSEGAVAAARASVAVGMIGRVGGSSMFAVRAPGRRALLFNGPQLGFSIPELFVELEVHSPGFSARGVTAAGIPLVAIGHNDRVAWGYTSGLSDVDSLYAEQLAGSAEKYRFSGADRSMECRNETFRFRSPPTDLLSLTDVLTGGGPPAPPSAGSRVERICRTVHGPVEVRAGNVAYARRYATWGRELETINGLTSLMEARSIKDVDAAMQQVTWNENVMAADSDGNIGYWHPGLQPLRPRGWDERLPYPGTGEAEWRGLLDRRRTPYVINPKQGWLANWNNVPSQGWTSGDGEARERQTGPWHRVGWLMALVRKLRRAPSFERAQATIQQEGSTAQQRPRATARLARARRGSSGRARAVLDALLRWDGSYVRTASDGTVDPGVAIWEQFKDEAERIAAERLGGGFEASAPLRGEPGSSHMFDIALGEAYGLRVLSPAGLRSAADTTYAALAKRFGTEDVSRWREPRRMYDVTAQGAASAPDLPFFDRGTWEQLVQVGP